MRRKLEPIDVIARHGRDGAVDPLQFSWNERTYRVLDVGRRWQDYAGEHILVMVVGGEIHELLHDADGRWSIQYRPGASVV